MSFKHEEPDGEKDEAEIAYSHASHGHCLAIYVSH
jgi:hypothetical protein